MRVCGPASSGVVFVGPTFVSLLLVGGYADIALRDFGLLLAALTLFRLASAYSGRAPNAEHVS